MKHRGLFRLLCLLLVGCVSMAHSHAVVRPSCCSPTKPEATEGMLLCETGKACCGAVSDQEKALVVSAASESGDLPGPLNSRGCCESNCCKVFQTLTFAAAGAGYSFRLLECASMHMVNLSLPSSDFFSSLLRPPQA
ncbi:MAG: hypothetical protein FJ118_14925 [Deltaproteobacteria bacterium]|nr:hypothetical protein [Deltaproteobacteria bacterium]